MKVYLVRHGESVFNAQGLYQGKLDTALTERGRNQARALAEKLPSGAQLYCSAALRARETAEIIGSFYDLSPVSIDCLWEIWVGDLEGVARSSVPEFFPEFVASQKNDKIATRYPGGESYNDVRKRVEPFVKELEKDKDAIIVGHKVVNRVLLSLLLNRPLAEIAEVHQFHDQVIVVDLESFSWSWLDKPSPHNSQSS